MTKKIESFKTTVEWSMKYPKDILNMEVLLPADKYETTTIKPFQRQ